MYSPNKDIDLKFVPILDRHENANALIIAQNAHQVFGRFYGVFKTKDGDIQLNGRLGFAEKVFWPQERWKGARRVRPNDQWWRRAKIWLHYCGIHVLLWAGFPGGTAGNQGNALCNGHRPDRAGGGFGYQSRQPKRSRGLFWSKTLWDARGNHVCVEKETGRRIPADKLCSVWLHPQEWRKQHDKGWRSGSLFERGFFQICVRSKNAWYCKVVKWAGRGTPHEAQKENFGKTLWWGTRPVDNGYAEVFIPKPDLYGCGGKWKPPDHCRKLPWTIHNQRTVSCVPVQSARGRKQNLHSEKLQKAESAGKAHCLYLWTRTLLAQIVFVDHGEHIHILAVPCPVDH